MTTTKAYYCYLIFFSLFNFPGVLVHYDDPVAHLSDLFFVQPEWLCHVISSVVKVRDPNCLVTNGLIKRTDLVNWIKDEQSTVKLPYDLLPHFLRYDNKENNNSDNSLNTSYDSIIDSWTVIKKA
jgi:hypothetical protein